VTIEIADVIAAVILGILGNGLLGNYLLRRLENEQERKLTRLRTDLEREVRTLQSSLDRTVLIHRAQFETEFAALRFIWKRLANVRGTMGIVRPTADIIPQNETPEEKRNREWGRLSDFVDATNKLVTAVHSRSPFIPKDIYAKLDAAILIAKSEATEFRLEYDDRDRNPMRDWYRRGREHYDEFCALTIAISDLIRDRLEKLTIVA
jgi:hypothetical protein